jgi:hypothetical protein
MSQTTEQTTALTVIPAGSVPTILAADTGDILGKLRAELAGFKRDGSTEKGRKECRSAADRVSTAKADLLRVARGLKESHQKTLKAIIAEEHVVEDQFNAFRARL